MAQLADVSKETPVQKMLRLYSEGQFDEEICAGLGMSTGTFEQKIKEDTAFRQLVELGRLQCKAWWMTQGRKAVFNKDMNHSAWAFIMKNRFGWADKTETITNTGFTGVSTDELQAKIRKQLEKMTKIDPTLAAVFADKTEGMLG